MGGDRVVQALDASRARILLVVSCIRDRGPTCRDEKSVFVRLKPRPSVAFKKNKKKKSLESAASYRLASRAVERGEFGGPLLCSAYTCIKDAGVVRAASVVVSWDKKSFERVAHSG